jgi:hypothetical protein
MATTKKAASGKKSTGAGKKGKVEKVMKEFKEGELHSGSKDGPIVKDRDQAIAIALSEAREAGEDVPPQKGKSKAKTKKS